MFCTNDKQELLALHRIIVEAKYSVAIVDSAIVSSSLVADISNRIIDSALEEMEVQEAKSWLEWLEIEPCGRHYKILVDHIKKFENWIEVSEADKSDLVKTLAAPLRLNDSLIEDLIDIGNSHWKT